METKTKPKETKTNPKANPTGSHQVERGDVDFFATPFVGVVRSQSLTTHEVRKPIPQAVHKGQNASLLPDPGQTYSLATNNISRAGISMKKPTAANEA